jgi:protein-disulfide isomerase
MMKAQAKERRGPSRATVVGWAAVVALVGVGVLAVAARPERAAPVVPPEANAAGPTLPLTVEQEPDLLLAARTKGDSAAPITIYEVADFQCPACREFWEETLPGIEREYVRTGKVRLVFVNFPIVSLHRNAPAAHLVAMCAAQHGRFWPMHDLLFEKQVEWQALADPQAFFRTLAQTLGLTGEMLQACASGGRLQAMVEMETETLARSGVRSTPSFIVQGALLAGAAPLSVWRPILDSISTAVAAAR